jgi:hypothetical protein
MTQTGTEQEQREAAGGRVTMELQTFAESLTADERAVLGRIFEQAATTLRSTGDTEGFAGKGDSGALDAINAIDWAAVYKAFGITVSTGSNATQKP